MKTNEEILALIDEVAKRNVNAFELTADGFRVVFRASVSSITSKSATLSDAATANSKQRDKKEPTEFNGMDHDTLLASAG